MGMEIDTLRNVLTANHAIIREAHDGIQALVFFPNGYGASVVNHSGSYGIEMAVIRGTNVDNWNLDYSTPITNDVIGHIQDADELLGYFERIAAL